MNSSPDDFRLDAVDFIKVDEGSEYPVCGPKETMRFRPVVIFECNGHDVRTYGKSHNCVEYMQSLGAHVLKN